MQRIFIDMDGTVAQWNPDASIEEVASKGYFLKRNPENNLIKAIEMIDNLREVELFILSAVFTDDHSVKEKMEWLSKYMPWITEEHCIFVPYGESKSTYVETYTGFLRDDDVLIDDFSKNLLQWHGVGVKFFNGLNGTKGSWKGYGIFHKQEIEYLTNTLKGILLVTNKNIA